MERLPQTRFPSLPEGTFLVTDYAKPRAHWSPSNNYGGTDGASKQPVLDSSPIKFCEDEDSNRVVGSKIEHGRKPSKGSARGKKQAATNSETNSRNTSGPVSAVNVDNESGLQPEEAFGSSAPDSKAASTAHVNQSSTGGTDPMVLNVLNQDTGAIHSDVDLDRHASSITKTAGDRAQNTSSCPGAKCQIQERSSKSSRHTEGRTKASKKKSKGSNKLSVSDKKNSEPPTGHTAFGNAKPKARAKTPVNESVQCSVESGLTLENKSHTESEVEASRMIASKVLLDPTSTLKQHPKPADQETTDQSFLGRKATETDGEGPEDSVANVNRGDDKMDTLETESASLETARSSVPSVQSEELTSQAMRRYVSNSTQGSVDTTWSLLSYTGPPTSSQTERSSSFSQENLSPIVRAACPSLETTALPHCPKPGQLSGKAVASIAGSTVSQSESAVISKGAWEEDGQPQKGKFDVETSVQDCGSGETPTKHKPRTIASRLSSKTQKDATHVEELQNPTKGDVRAGPSEKNTEKASSTLSMQPSLSTAEPALPINPSRKRAMSIPPRSSSLAAPSTPIKTHQKKKPRNLTHLTEVLPSSVTGLPADRTRKDSNLQIMESTKLNFAVSSADHVEPAPTIERSRDLPKPETPFLMDDGVRIAPPKISRRVLEASNVDRYYAQKNDYQVFYWSSNTHYAKFRSLDSSDTASTHPSETSTPDSASAKKQDDLEASLREAGYRTLSGISPFTIKDPALAFLETLDEQGKPLDNRTNEDGPLLTWFDDKGKIGQVMSLDAWTKQHELTEVVKKATAAKRLLADSPPLTWTKMESLQQKLSRFVTQDSSGAYGQRTTDSKDPRILKAESLLNTIPQREASTSEMLRWSTRVSFFIEQNASEQTPADIETRELTTSSSSRRRQQEHRRPVLINQPDPQILARKLERNENGFGTAITDSDESLTSGRVTESELSPSTYGRRTPSEEGSTPSVAFIPSTALSPIGKLKDPFEKGEDRGRWSNHHHWSGTPQEEEPMKTPDPTHESSSGEFEVGRLTRIVDVGPEPGLKKQVNETQQHTHTGKPCKGEENELGSDDEKQNRRISVEFNVSEDPKPAEPKWNRIQGSEDSAHQKQPSQLPQVSSSSFQSGQPTSNESTSDEVQLTRPRGGHSPLKRSGYNAVAGRGIDGKRNGNKEASKKDPWALPQGEKPWGCGGEGRGRQRRRDGR